MAVFSICEHRRLVDRRRPRSRRRVKARSLTLGATRFRLIQILLNLGFDRERIESGRQAAREAKLVLERARLARLLEEERLALLREERKQARSLQEKQAYEAMTEDQRAAWRFEWDIVSWVTGAEMLDSFEDNDVDGKPV